MNIHFFVMNLKDTDPPKVDWYISLSKIAICEN